MSAGRTAKGGVGTARPRLPIVVALALALALTALVHSAAAHHGEPATGGTEPGELGSETTGGTVSTDEESGNATPNVLGTSTPTLGGPVAKDGAQAGWQQLAGSLWREGGDITVMATPPGLPESPTPYDLDFYGLDFHDETNGFAAGAQCRRDPDEPDEPVAAEDVAGCVRVPAIYRYHDDQDRGLVWEQSYPGSDDEANDPGGFVAAVTWLAEDRALAVGGTGTYPRRERELSEEDRTFCEEEAGAIANGIGADSDAFEACADKKRVENDIESGAGLARAWLYEDADGDGEGSWREITGELPGNPGCQSVQTALEDPDCMRALQTVSASPRPADCGPAVTAECAVAGGMRQLWHFTDGEFTEGFGPELSDGGPFADADGAFRFRVRDIRFAPNWRGLGSGAPTAVPPDTPLQQYARAVSAGCCSADPANDRSGLLAFDSGLHPLHDYGWRATPAAEDSESYYAVSFLRDNCCIGSGDRLLNLHALRTPGGPSERYFPDEPSPGFDRPEQPGTAAAPPLGPSSLRLVSADGDVRLYSTTAPDRLRPDGVPDWAVGAMRSTGRGAAFNVAGFEPCPAAGQDEKLVDAGEDNQSVPTPDAFWAQRASKNLCSLTSYALNAYRVAGEDVFEGREGTGWAVGDHGAIVTRGGGVAGAEDPPARQGAKPKGEPLPRGEAFDERRPPTTDSPGPVPAIVPGAHPAEPAFREEQNPFGEPGQNGEANLIAMSRDGSEGWAMRSINQSSVYRYDGLRWTPCDPEGIPGLVPPDPACAELPGDIRALARVPLENDSDPTNDEVFEAVALTDSGLYRYRGEEGRWFRDPDATYKDGNSMKPVSGEDVAFTAPDDGWVVNISGTAVTTITVLHFDGERWVKCTGSPASPNAEPEACGDDAAHSRLSIEQPCSGANADANLAVAGERVYLYSIRQPRPDGNQACNVGVSSVNAADTYPIYPLILFRDTDKPCETPGDPGCWQGGTDTTADGTYNPTDGGWDPGCVTGSGTGCEPLPEPENLDYQGRVDSLSVARDTAGSLQGWAAGLFGGSDRENTDVALLMRLSDGGDVPDASNRGGVAWRYWTVHDAADDYLRLPGTFGNPIGVDPDGLLALPTEAGERSAFLSISGKIGTTFWFGPSATPPMLAFDQERERWTAVPTPWSVSPPSLSASFVWGEANTIAPDGRGGFWAAVSEPGGSASRKGFSFHHYTDRAPAEPFAESADPTRGEAQITALDAGPDGTLWLGDESGNVYRHDRLAGWSGKARIPGWDPARVTRPAPVRAIAAGPEGSGLAVGDGGRIANLGEQVGLDPAATAACDPKPAPPCGTGRDLLAAAIAPDGSAIVAGKARTLLWRPPGGDFRPPAGAPPPVPLGTPIADIEMPSPDRAYLLTEAGNLGAEPASRVIRGEMTSPGQWSWRIEVSDSEGSPDPLTAGGVRREIRSLAVAADGHGYAVGPSGMILERTGDGEGTWRRVATGDRGNLEAVALPAGGGEGALIGGHGGRILTRARDRFEVARHATRFEPGVAGENDTRSGGIAELAIAPGYAEGTVEAWALRQGTAGPSGGQFRSQALLHHPADPADPRLAPARALSRFRTPLRRPRARSPSPRSESRTATPRTTTPSKAVPSPVRPESARAADRPTAPT